MKANSGVNILLLGAVGFAAYKLYEKKQIEKELQEDLENGSYDMTDDVEALEEELQYRLEDVSYNIGNNIDCRFIIYFEGYRIRHIALKIINKTNTKFTFAAVRLIWQWHYIRSQFCPYSQKKITVEAGQTVVVLLSTPIYKTNDYQAKLCFNDYDTLRALYQTIVDKSDHDEKLYDGIVQFAMSSNGSNGVEYKAVECNGVATNKSVGFNSFLQSCDTSYDYSPFIGNGLTVDIFNDANTI